MELNTHELILMYKILVDTMNYQIDNYNSPSQNIIDLHYKIKNKLLELKSIKLDKS